MNLKKAAKLLNIKLRKKNPETFSSTWICENASKVYRFVVKNLRTENGEIDWDSLTLHLDKKFQKKWMRFKRKTVKQYENKEELNKILTKYQSKLYTFITLYEKDDKQTRHKIIVALVRIAQKGNILAKIELTNLLMYTLDTWIERYDALYKWKSHRDQVEEKIHCCIRGYRYTGSFTNYLFRTLELSGRGLRYFRTCSLDKQMFDGEVTLIDFLVKEENNEVFTFGKRSNN